MYYFLALAALLIFVYLLGKYMIGEEISLDGYYEIDPSFAEAASLENMSLLMQGEYGMITLIEDEPMEIPFIKEGSVFVSEIDSPLTNKVLVIYLNKDGVLDIFSEGVHLASFVKDNMLSLQLKK
jgi:hypothetical protein